MYKGEDPWCPLFEKFKMSKEYVLSQPSTKAEVKVIFLKTYFKLVIKTRAI